MKLRFAFWGLLSLIAVSCSYEESFIQENNIYNSSAEFYATIDEQPEADTKVYADENLKVLWNEDDRMSIFNKNTFNQEFRFTGDDGDNAGSIVRVGDAGSGDPLEHIYAVYPYVESTVIDASGTLSFTLPSEQSYHKKSFGIGANTMVSVTDDIRLRFKNVGGYLSLKFYGDGVSVSSIVLKGNNGELLSGPCSIVTSSGIPAVTMSSGASDQVTLVCDPLVELGATSSEAVQFIFVLPPVTLTEGFTVTVTTPEGAVFEKSSSNKFEIGRSAITKLGAMEVVPVFSGNIVFADPEVKRICVENWDTDGNGDLSYEEAAVVTDLNQVFKNNTLITSFDELQYFTGLTYIGKKETYSNGYSILSSDFWGCTNLTSVVLPETVKEIGVGAFAGCESLSSIEIPASVNSIHSNAFGYTGFTSITFPEGSSINFHEGAFANSGSLSTVRFEGAISSYGVESGVFEGCPITDLYFGKEFNYLGIIGSPYYSPNNLYYQLFRYYGNDLLDICTIEVSDQNSKYDSRDNCNALIETATNSLILGCKNTTIPESVTCIASGSLTDIDPLTSFIVPATVTSIGGALDPRLESITLESMTPPILIDDNLFGDNWDNDDTPTIIYVPTESLNAYKTADGWSRYADRIQATPDIIVFEDTNVKDKLVAAFDTDGDGELSYDEAAAATSIDGVFGTIKTYKSFNEFRFFTGITTIPAEMFKEWQLTSITIPDSVVSIGRSAFMNCRYLTSIIIPDSVIYLGSSVFEGCSGLDSAILGKSVKFLQSQNSPASSSIFKDCSALNSIEIPNSVTAITSRSFYGCSSLTSITIPESVTSIGSSAFNSCSSLSSIVLPESVTSIGSSAFNSCSSLSSIVLPESVMSIGSSAFRDCSKLSSPIVLPSTLGTVEKSVFENCSSLVSVTIPESVSRINDEAFSGCSSLSSIVIPDFVTSIGEKAFWGCSSLETIRIPQSVTTIENSVFYLCSGMTAVDIPESVTSIGEKAFYFCTSLETINIPDSVTSIGIFAFAGCSSLASFVFPSFVTEIGADTFYQCYALSSIVIPESVTSIGEQAFMNCRGLSSVTIPDSVVSIGNRAFDSCTSLPSICIPDSVTSMGDSSFNGCSNLNSVIIGDSIESIGRYSFQGCGKLSSVTIKNTVPPSISSSLFGSLSFTIYVPAESVDTYKAAEYWSSYANRISAIQE